jgi:hypothetical protein
VRETIEASSAWRYSSEALGAQVMTKSTPFSIGLAVCGLVSALTSGCQQQVHCPVLKDCGGPVPVGTWTLTPQVVDAAGNVIAPIHGSCIEDLYVPVSDPRLVGGGDVPAARTPPPEPALYDWCDGLLTSSGTKIDNRDAVFYTESAPVGVASIRLDATGAWSSGITRTGTFLLDFPALCMREFGAMDGRSIDPMAMPPGPPGDVCAQLQVAQRAAGMGTGAYQNTTCKDNPADPGGCLCEFEDQETGGPSGYYQRLDNNTLMFLSDKGFPNRVTYCNEGTSLELTGQDGEYLFGIKGLRTLDLAVANCTDGIKGPYEQGVDCGGQCAQVCGAAAPPAAGAAGAPATGTAGAPPATP